MCFCTKFHFIRRTSNFETELTPPPPKKKKIYIYMNNKNFEKINIKFEIRIKQCTPVTYFSQFGDLQFLGPNLPKKTLETWSFKTNPTGE